MAHPKKIIIKESLEELRRLQKRSVSLIAIRIRALIETKRAGEAGISKRELAARIGVDPNSIQSWRRLYEQGGIASILQHGRIGFKPSILNAEEHAAVEAKLHNPKNGLRGYVELQQWIEQEFGKKMLYNTVLKYCVRHFGSKSKVARKSHVKKDDKAVETFKKTSVNSAGKSSKKKTASIQR
jgi:transposase